MDTDWVPNRLADKVSLYTDIKQNAGTVGKELGLDSTAAVEAADNWLATFAEMETTRTTAEGAAKTFQKQNKPSEDAVRGFVKQVKANPQVTPAQLALLHASGSATRPQDRVAALAPVLELHQEGGHVVVKFGKHGHQGILLYGRRDPETEWSLLGLDTISPYHDTRPNVVPGQAETRHYRAYFADRDQPVGELSAEVALAVR